MRRRDRTNTCEIELKGRSQIQRGRERERRKGRREGGRIGTQRLVAGITVPIRALGSHLLPGVPSSILTKTETVWPPRLPCRVGILCREELPAGPQSSPLLASFSDGRAGLPDLGGPGPLSKR